MVSEADPEPSSTTPKLSYLSLPNQVPEPPGMLTPPLRRLASVPFQWEEEPGKPKLQTSTTTMAISTDVLSKSVSARCLELPPRLLSEMKTSPTTVLEGPYMSRSASYSMSFSRERCKRLSYGSSPERVRGGHVGKLGKSKERGSFSSWLRKGLRGNRRVGEDNFVNSPTFSSSSSSTATTWSSYSSSSGGGGGGNRKVKITSFRRSGSLSVLSLSNTKSHLWESISGKLKQVVPFAWKNNRKMKKDGCPTLTSSQQL